MKIYKRKKGNEDGEDIFNKLPEFVIGHILSLLPTEDAVRTSVLSKSWVSRWTLVNKLHLDDWVFYSPKKKTGSKSFINFVYRALHLTKSSTLVSFTLVLNYKYDAYPVNTWISSILIKNVKNLCIRSHLELPLYPHTSHSLFELKLLEELEITTGSAGIVVRNFDKMKSGSTVTGSSPCKKKLPERKKGNEDIFSKLPEFLIGRILSFLPTKDAVRTSVLSKRWLSRWTLINKLDLDDSVFYSSKKKAGVKLWFTNFVHRALLLTKSPSIDSFSLVIGILYDPCLFNTWISSILIRNVKKLRISSHLGLHFSPFTSHSLFELKLLEELEITSGSCSMSVPPINVDFRCLKFLKLCGIAFTIDSSVRILCLRLPVLKEFETKNCVWLGENAKGVSLEAPLLERVYIETGVSHWSRSCAIKFSALHLSEFTYCGHGRSQPIVLSDPSSAHNASANIILNQYRWDPTIAVPETGLGASLLLKQFSQVKYLKFLGSEVLTQKIVAALPEFGMLNHLELGLVSGEVFLGLLLKTPVLKTLHFKEISYFEQELLNSAVVPGCLGTTLRSVKFEKVNGLKHELCLAKFLREKGVWCWRE